jgi:hypothetical protein
VYVVLEPTVVPVQTEWMRQVHLGPLLGEDVGRPVPATGRLRDDLGAFAGSRHRGSEVGVVVDVDRLEPLALFAGPIDERTMLLQIRCCCRSIATCCPTGSPFTEVVVEDPECDDVRILR